MKQPRPLEQWKLIYVSDPSGIANYDFDPGRGRPLITSHPATPEELRNVVNNIAAGRPDVLIQEVYNAGWTMYFRSKQFEYDARPQHRRFIPMMDEGIMPLDVLADQAPLNGLSFMAGFRMNDSHGAPDQGAMFLHENPQWKLRQLPAGAAFVPGNRMDFTFDGVRDYVLGVIAEVVEHYDVDGIELVFREGLYFPAPDGDRSIARERQPLMTELIARARNLLDTAGRRLVLGVRVPQTLEECHNSGLDVPAWIDHSLVDYVAPQDAMFSDFNAHFEEFSSLTGATECRLFPGALPYCCALDRGAPPLTLDNYRALVHTFYSEGADGISFYNYQMHWDAFWKTGRDPGPETMYPLALGHLRELRDLDRVKAGPRHYLFHPMWHGSTAFGGPGMTAGGVLRDNKILLPRREKRPRGYYSFRLYEDFDRLAFARLFFRATGLGPQDLIGVRLNGQAVPEEKLRRIWHPDGRPQHMGRPLDAYTTCIVELSVNMVVRGENVLDIELVFSGRVEGDIVIDEVEVTTLPN